MFPSNPLFIGLFFYLLYFFLYALALREYPVYVDCK